MNELSEFKPQFKKSGVEIVNELFDKLVAVFPATASTIKSQKEFKEIKIQWVIGLQESGITSTELLKAGLSVARRQETPFLPSVGVFCKWCEAGIAEKHGILTPDELITKYHQFCAVKGFDDEHKFNFDGDVNYWLIHDLYRLDHECRINIKEKAKELISEMIKKIIKGYKVPKPRLTIPKQTSVKVLSREERLKKIAEIKSKFTKSLQGGAV